MALGSGWIDPDRTSARHFADAAVPWGSLAALVAAIVLESCWPVVAWALLLAAFVAFDIRAGMRARRKHDGGGKRSP